MSAFSIDKWEKLFHNIGPFFHGFGVTLYIVLFALLLSLVLGVVFGVMSAGYNKVLRGISRVYVEFFQNTPLLVQIFFLYNALPYMNINLSAVTIGILGVGVYHTQIMKNIVLPQALKNMLPPLTNIAANLIKNTSILAVIAGGDLMYQADSFASTTLAYGPAYVVVGIMYFIICFPLSRLSGYLEEKFGEKPNPKDYSELLASYKIGEEESK